MNWKGLVLQLRAHNLRRPLGLWVAAFIHYYNRHHPNQSLDNRISAEEVMNR